MENFKQFSDQRLFEICKEYGLNAKTWMRKFIGLLPEVNRRKLYESKGFSSITEFAAKLAGMRKKHTYRVLNLDHAFEDKPILREMLEQGEMSIHKLARVVSVVTVENQSFWAEQVKILPKSALETLVRDYKLKNQIGSMKPKTNDQDVPGHTLELEFASGIGNEKSAVGMIGCRNGSISDIKHGQPEDRGQQETQSIAGGSNQDGLAPAGEGRQGVGTTDRWQPHVQPAVGLIPSSILKLQLSESVIQKLLDLQQKGIDINEFILEMLQNREQEIFQEKETIAAEVKPTDSRYIPRKIKKLVEKEYGKKCAVPTCRRPSIELHHTNRFSLAKTHDPHFIAPLCRDHHKIAHSIDLKYHQHRNWLVEKVIC